MATSNPLRQAPIHESDNVGRHRIVTFRAGIPEHSPWFQAYEIAIFRDLRATAQDILGLPRGIFRVASVKHEVL